MHMLKLPVCIDKHTHFIVYRYTLLLFQVIWQYSKDSCPVAVSQLLCFQNCGAVLKAFSAFTDCGCAEVTLTLIFQVFL